jgi:hypothetical protein
MYDTSKSHDERAGHLEWDVDGVPTTQLFPDVILIPSAREKPIPFVEATLHMLTHTAKSVDASTTIESVLTSVHHTGNENIQHRCNKVLEKCRAAT